MLDHVRSLLFVPADSPKRLEAAFASAADAVVADLEDAVPAERKSAARALLAGGLPTTRPRTAAAGGASGGPARLVRVNAPETGMTGDDLEAIAGLELDGIVVPKATPDAVASLGPDGPPVVAIIESAAGLRSAHDIAVQPRVVALILGAADLSADLRLEQRPDAAELLYARSKVVVDAAAAGIRAPFDRVFPGTDAEGLAADAALARSLGFGGKGCTRLHEPDVVNRVFANREHDAAASKAAMFEPG